jgi:hypothetical protein
MRSKIMINYSKVLFVDGLDKFLAVVVAGWQNKLSVVGNRGDAYPQNGNTYWYPNKR